MTIKVISFNIRCIDDENGYSIPERAPRLAAVVTPYDADVIGFQEYSPFWEEYVRQYYCDKYEFFNQYRTDKEGLESTPILWKKDKFDCLKHGYFWFSDTPEIMSGGWDDYGCNRICLYVVLQDKKSGKIFTYLNTHFGFGMENQLKSVRLLQQYMRSISLHPTFVTGDFNMTLSSLPYAEMVKNFADVNEMTVQDRRSTYHGYNKDNTYDEHIDYCFVDDKIRPLSFNLIDEMVDGKFPSDHYGFYTELKIK